MNSPRIVVLTVLAFTVIGSAWSFGSGGIMYMLLEPGIDAPSRLESIRTYFESWGAAGPLAYMAVVTAEVILAPIPGTVLYLPGGVIFGWFLGGLASLAGNVLGAGIACQAMRTIGGARLNRFIETSALLKYEALVESRGLWIVFLLRVNPLTSSDLVSYAAGLTRLPVWKVMMGTLLGMAPLCFAQAYFAQELFTRFPGLIYPLVIIGVIYAAYVIRILHRMARQAGSPSVAT